METNVAFVSEANAFSVVFRKASTFSTKFLCRRSLRASFRTRSGAPQGRWIQRAGTRLNSGTQRRT